MNWTNDRKCKCKCERGDNKKNSMLTRLFPILFSQGCSTNRVVINEVIVQFGVAVYSLQFREPNVLHSLA